MVQHNNIQDQRLAVIETKLENIERSSNEIHKTLSNHVTTLYKKMEGITRWQISILTSLILLLIGVIINFLK